MLEFGQAGLKYEAINKAIPVASKMVIATNEDMKTSVNALTIAYNAWNLKASDFAKTGDMMSAAVAESSLKVADLSTIFNYVASTASLANTSLRDTLVLSTALSKVGAKPSTIGTGLGQFVAAVSKMTPKAKGMFERYGLDPKEMQKMVAIEGKTLEALKKMQKAGMDVIALFEGLETRTGRAAAGVISLPAEVLAQIEQKIDTPGMLDKMFGKSMEGFKNQWSKFTNIVQNAFISLGQSFENDIGGLFDKLAGLGNIIQLIFGNKKDWDNVVSQWGELSEPLKVIIAAFLGLNQVLGITWDVLIIGSQVVLIGVRAG